jgi:alpha-methylacyl-CoA racemase
VLQPSPAPRFSATPATLDRPPPSPGEHTDEVLAGLGYAPGEIADLRSAGAVA